MTLERPMFPPRAEASNVVNFATAYIAKVDKHLTSPKAAGIQRLFSIQAQDDKALRRKQRDTPTARNLGLRLARRAEWWKAWHVTSYWRARLDWLTALESAQRWNVADAKRFEEADGAERPALLALWRTALGNRLLTPAPTMEAVQWKRAQLRDRGIVYVPVKRETIEKAIADDVEWLAAHPVRKTKTDLGGAA